ncbi:MAG TPA: hypothetical protein V6D05_09630 [Stenomitos sp.]
MDGTDAFKRSGPGAGSNPFADRSYSDQFVRSATQPLGRRATRPLEITPEVFAQQVAATEEQIQLCRTILDRFGPRVRLLKTASEQAKKPLAPPAPEPKKSLKPPAFKKPMAPPAPAGGPMSPTDKALVDKIARRLAEKVDLARRAAIAVHQFEEASRAVAETFAKLNQARAMDPVQGMTMLESLETSKLQGRVYPICNFYEVFKDDDAFWSLFPPPAQTSNQTPKSRTFGK